MVVKGITKRWLLNSLGVILILIVALVFSLSYAIQNYIYYGIQQAINGRAGEVWEARKDMDGPVSVLTDIYDRTGVPLGPLPIETAAGQALKYGSDGLILTGRNFGESLELVDRVRKHFPQAPVYLGGGITEKNVGEAIPHCDGMIVSSCLLEDGKDNEWSRQKIKSFMDCVHGQ